MIEASIKRKLVLAVLSIAVGWPGVVGSQVVGPHPTELPPEPMPPPNPGPDLGIAPGPGFTSGPDITPAPGAGAAPNSSGSTQGATPSKAAEELTPEDRARVLSQLLDTLPVVAKAKLGTQ
jgi:hypothetical protein